MSDRLTALARGAGLILALSGWACAAAAVAAPEGTVHIDLAAQSHLGVAVQRLDAAKHTSDIDAFAKVLDPGPLAQLDSDLVTAVAAAAASSAEARRSRMLNAAGGSVSAKDMEAAIAQAQSDSLHVKLLRQRLGLEWGPGVARMSDSQRAALIKGLSAGSIALVHVDTHNNEGQDGARFVKVDVGSDSVRGRVIGAARQAEPRLQSSGLIVEITGKSALLLSIGLTQSAHIETATQDTGVMAPRSALIRFKGSDWAYVRTSPTDFARRMVQDPQPEADAVFVAHGLNPGDEVVVKGASALFAAEQAQPVTP